MNQDVSNDRFFRVEKIRRKNLKEEMKAAVTINKDNAVLVKEQFENTERKLREKLKDEAIANVITNYGVKRGDENFDYFLGIELSDLVKKALRKQMSKRNTKAVDEMVEPLPISHVTSTVVGAKSKDLKAYETVISDNLDGVIDRRNQIFKLQENYIEIEGEIIRDVSFKFALSFKSFYWVSDGRIVVGEERPELKSGQFSLYNRGIMNSKKRNSLAFAGSKVLGCSVEEVSFVWYQNKPHMMNESTRTLLEINIVDSKAYGFKEGLKHI